MQPGQRVGAAGAAGDEAHAGATGGLGIGFGHHRGAAFLAAHHQGDVRRVVQRIEHRQKALPGDREHPVHTVASEQFDDGLAAIGLGIGCHRFLAE